jgi:hypothetical protein
VAAYDSTINATTGLPLGHRACGGCQVTWNACFSSRCWMCGKEDRSTNKP